MGRRYPKYKICLYPCSLFSKVLAPCKPIHLPRHSARKQMSRHRLVCGSYSLKTTLVTKPSFKGASSLHLIPF